MLKTKELAGAGLSAKPIDGGIFGVLGFWSVDGEVCEKVAGASIKGVQTMEWVTPQHEEIDLNCEISSYANAEL